VFNTSQKTHQVPGISSHQADTHFRSVYYGYLYRTWGIVDTPSHVVQIVVVIFPKNLPSISAKSYDYLFLSLISDQGRKFHYRQLSSCLDSFCGHDTLSSIVREITDDDVVFSLEHFRGDFLYFSQNLVGKLDKLLAQIAFFFSRVFSKAFKCSVPQRYEPKSQLISNIEQNIFFLLEFLIHQRRPNDGIFPVSILLSKLLPRRCLTEYFRLTNDYYYLDSLLGPMTAKVFRAPINQ
jgi:hypothetical protein